MPSENNKRIAKNTLLLYFRMLLTMGVTLFTVRIVLDTLGTVDYGIYNVVGGIVVMFSFLSGTMASASQRFFAFEIGRNDQVQLKKTFSMTMTIYSMIAVLILILAETVGLWFLNTQMTIPPERMEAARWVYQFSVLSFMMTMFTIPYNAVIIAHERMNVYAWVSIIEVSLKLLIVYLLVVFSFDKLKLYAVLMFGVTTLVTLIYRTYTQRKFSESRFSFHWNTALFKEIVSYSGWNLFGALSSVLKSQGINILLNMFFDPTINAARGIVYQVNNAIANFGNNFYTAVRPQIIKSFASNKHNEMMYLAFQSTKFSYYLLYILSLPILLEPNFILNLWLKEIPDYTSIFLQLVIVDMLIESLANPIVSIAQATGRIKWYQIIVGGTRILILPIAYILLKMEYPPESVFYVMIAITFLCGVERIIIVKKLANLNVSAYIRDVIFIIILVTISTCIFPILFQKYWKIDNPILIISLAIFCSLISILTVGTSKKEKKFLFLTLKNKLKLS